MEPIATVTFLLVLQKCMTSAADQSRPVWTLPWTVIYDDPIIAEQQQQQ